MRFDVIAFYTGAHEAAHTSFVEEANEWFTAMAGDYGFTYTSTNDWSKLNDENMARYQVVIFLEVRAEAPEQRRAFQKYIEHGGAWMGFHFAAFALTPSAYPAYWDWYHDIFLGSGQFVSNTWRPTSAVLKIEDVRHPSTAGLPSTFTSAPNEWYRWHNDLRRNPDIDILASIDESSFPLGSGPKPHEIWHEGYFPVVWSNRRFRMIYLNMGHNVMDFDTQPNRRLSSSFASDEQNRLILNSLLWLGKRDV